VISAIGDRNLCGLRGFWNLEKEAWSLAKQSLQLAVTLAHKAGKVDRRSEIRLALAKYKLGELSDPEQVTEQFSRSIEKYCYRHLAELLAAIGAHDGAKKYATAAYFWSLSDGEPFVHRYELNKSKALLVQLGANIPELPNYDPIKDKKLVWEDKVAAAIEQLQHVKPKQKKRKTT